MGANLSCRGSKNSYVINGVRGRRMEELETAERSHRTIGFSCARADFFLSHHFSKCTLDRGRKNEREGRRKEAYTSGEKSHVNGTPDVLMRRSIARFPTWGFPARQGRLVK